MEDPIDLKELGLETDTDDCRIDDAMIRAAIYSSTEKEDLKKTYEESGLIGVYNLGLHDMFDYLRSIETQN